MFKISKKTKFLAFTELFPNIITLSAMGSGLTAIRFALAEKWEISVIFILISMILDAMDGRVARMLKSTSSFGAQLDSLSDLINFGVAPAILNYLWILKNISFKGVAWGMAIFYIMCCAVRLARFNSDLEDENMPKWMGNFFIGISSPVAALMALVPLMISFEFDVPFEQYPLFLGIYLCVVGALMPSRIPTFSFKQSRIPQEYSSLFLAVVAIVITGVLIQPWLVLPILGVIYLMCMPFSIFKFHQLKNKIEIDE